jgi:predicted nucleotidyltransferase
MGRVYSPEQIKNGQIPEQGAHEAAGQHALKELFPCVVPAEIPDSDRLFEINDPGVQAAMVYGSTAYGTSSIRSDLDLLVFYANSQPHSASRHITNVLKETEQMFHVSVEANILPTDAIFDDLEHGLDPLFAQHLLEIHDTYNGRWCRNNPTDGLERIAEKAKDPLALTSLAQKYASGRRNYFISAAGELDYSVFQRALELPSAIGRKVVAATMRESDEPLDLSSRPTMNQRAILALETNLPNYDPATVQKHINLYELDRQYTNLLNDTLENQGDLDTYQKWIENNFTPAVEMAYDVSNAWVGILRSRKYNLARSLAGKMAVNKIDSWGEDELDVGDQTETTMASVIDLQAPTSYS